MIGYLISIIILCVVAYQDFKQRQISLLLLIALFAVFAILAFQAEDSLKVVVKNFIMNMGFVLIQFLFVKIYFSLRKMRNEILVDTYIGKGDLIFFLVSCLAFSITWFIPFYIGSLVIALATTIISNGVVKAKTVEIPLAGIMSTIMILCIAIKLLYNRFSFYNDSYMLHLLKISVE